MKRRLAAVGAAVLLSAGVAPGYYHFVHFQSRNAPFQPLYEKFDLNALADKTLPYFVSEAGGAQFANDDTYAALLSQIRLAASAWNGVNTSDLRLAFGGIAKADQPQSQASLQVLFEEMPPGYVAMGGPVVKADSNGTFVPIVRSVLKLQADFRKRPSYSEELFGTLVHEIGHALGLQHTFTSSAMAVSQTRAITKAAPIAADDAAAISTLYPRPEFKQSTGSISGRITMSESGSGVNLASVVALTPTGPAVSTLSNPDGTYRIEGLPPGKYSVYVHPVPPQANRETLGDLVYPMDVDGKEFLPDGPFDTKFYRSMDEVVEVTAGAATEGIDLAVRPKANYGIYSVDTRAYPGTFWVKPPYLTPGMTYSFLIASGENLVANDAPVPGLKVTVLGTGLEMGVTSYASGKSTHIQLDPPSSLEPSQSPRHLVFSSQNDLYVLPSAFYHVSGRAPSIQTLTPRNGDSGPTVAIAGKNLGEKTRILFDGVEAPVRSIEGDGELIVVPPPAEPGHRGVVTALNPDGQSSLYLQVDAPPAFTYSSEGAKGKIAAIRPSTLPPGTEAMIEVEGLSTNFTEGTLAAAFGTTDIVTRRVHVVSPTLAYINVASAPNAQPGTRNATVLSGIELMQDGTVFQIRAAQDTDFWLTSTTWNAANPEERATAVPGRSVAVKIGASPASIAAANTTVLLNDARLPVESVKDGFVAFRVPSDTSSGTAVVRLETDGKQSLPILITIDPAPAVPAPQIANNLLPGTVRPGDLVGITVTGIPDGPVSKVGVSLAGKDVKVLYVESAGRYRVFIKVPNDAPVGENVPLIVSVDGRASDPAGVTIKK